MSRGGVRVRYLSPAAILRVPTRYKGLELTVGPRCCQFVGAGEERNGIRCRYEDRSMGTTSLGCALFLGLIIRATRLPRVHRNQKTFYQALSPAGLSWNVWSLGPEPPHGPHARTKAPRAMLERQLLLARHRTSEANSAAGWGKGERPQSPRCVLQQLRLPDPERSESLLVLR